MLKIDWVHGTLWHTKEACDEACVTIHPRLGLREASTPVIRLDELLRWLEERHLELEHELIAEVLASNTYKEAMARHALAEVDILMAELRQAGCVRGA